MGSLPQLGKPRAPNYTDREVDIKRLGKAKTPDRLKGDAQLLTAKMISLVDKCKVKVLLERWCPTKVSLSAIRPASHRILMQTWRVATDQPLQTGLFSTQCDTGE